jgi:hypothetical protein
MDIRLPSTYTTNFLQMLYEKLTLSTWLEIKPSFSSSICIKISKNINNLYLQNV